MTEYQWKLSKPGEKDRYFDSFQDAVVAGGNAKGFSLGFEDGELVQLYRHDKYGEDPWAFAVKISRVAKPEPIHTVAEMKPDVVYLDNYGEKVRFNSGTKRFQKFNFGTGAPTRHWNDTLDKTDEFERSRKPFTEVVE